MTAASRTKGLRGEREVADAFEAADWTARGLEGQGDWLTVHRDGRLLHVEVKRQERLRLPEWLAQARAECPPGVAAVVCFRQNRGEWYVALPLSEFLGLLG